MLRDEVSTPEPVAFDVALIFMEVVYSETKSKRLKILNEYDEELLQHCVEEHEGL